MNHILERLDRMMEQRPTSEAAGDVPFLRLRGVGKRYGSTMVLRDVSLELAPGRCTALVGENGAGKSTLVAIMSGKISPSEGSMQVEGRPVTFRSPRDARARGIVVIPQELAYVPDLSVAENVVLANWPRRRPIAAQRWMRRRCREIFDDLEIDLDVRRAMIELPLADRQLVEVAKVLASHARLLILDEPTAALHARETEALLARLDALKRQRGVSLVYVSHHLDECFAIADDIAVLRNGRLADHTPAAATTRARTVAAMLGHEYQEPPAGVPPGAERPAVLEVSHWARARPPTLRDVSFTVHAGEVLGIFGLVGSGAEAIARGLGGHDSGISGALRHGGRLHPVPRSPRRARRLSVAYVPAERKTDGLALSQSVGEHLTMMIIGRHARLGWVRRRAQRRSGRALAERFDVRCRGLEQPTEQLSGGNQQKVLLASRIAASPRILVLHEPTRGVDVGSRAQIHRTLADFAREGAAVVVVTSDLQEAVDVTDRLLVMRAGRLVAELTGTDKTGASALAIAAAGAADDQSQPRP
jgi:ribose transport system ATP-binding protein